MNREELLKIAKPVLFNTEMVRAILDGRKTQTRRVVPIRLIDNYYAWCEHLDSIFNGPIQTLDKVDRSPKRYFQNSAKYKAGDILYVRETWSPLYPDEFSNHICGYMYKADNFNADEYDRRYPNGKAWTWSGKWKPSIHMPKEAARIFLKVTDVRVERLMNIRVDGVHKEGVDISAEPFERFKTLWDSTVKDHGTYGWDANPYVWVIEFERVTE